MEKIEQHDIETGQYILSVLSSRLDIVSSWGFDPKTLRPIKAGIQFHVQGFKHTVDVQVKLNEGADLSSPAFVSTGMISLPYWRTKSISPFRSE